MIENEGPAYTGEIILVGEHSPPVMLERTVSLSKVLVPGDHSPQTAGVCVWVVSLGTRHATRVDSAHAFCTRTLRGAIPACRLLVPKCVLTSLALWEY